MVAYAIENPDAQRIKVRKEQIHDGNCNTAGRMRAVSRGVVKSATRYGACGHIQSESNNDSTS